MDKLFQAVPRKEVTTNPILFNRKDLLYVLMTELEGQYRNLNPTINQNEFGSARIDFNFPAKIELSIHPPPGRAVGLAPEAEAYKRISVSYNNSTKHFPIKRPGTWSWGGIFEVIEDFYQLHLKAVAEREAEVTITQKMEARKKMRKLNFDERERVYNTLSTLVSELGTIENEIPAEYMNISLKNGFKVKITTEHDKIHIAEIESPVTFDPNKMGSIREFLEKIAKLEV